MAEMLQGDGRLNSCILIIYCGFTVASSYAHFKIEGSSSLRTSGAPEPTAAGCNYSGLDLSILGFIPHHTRDQYSGWRVARHNGAAHPILHSVSLVLLTESLVLEHLAVLRCALKPYPEPHTYRTSSKHVLLQVGLLATGNIHIQWASDPDAQLGEPKDQNKLEVLSTRENGRQFHPLSSSEMIGSFQLRPFDRLFYATNVQLAVYYIRVGRHHSPSAGTRTVGRSYQWST